MPNWKKFQIKKTEKKLVDTVEKNENLKENISDGTVESNKEKNDWNCNAETQSGRLDNVEIKPVVVDTRSWMKIHVKALYNRWSFNKGQEYWISSQVFDQYPNFFEIL